MDRVDSVDIVFWRPPLDTSDSSRDVERKIPCAPFLLGDGLDRVNPGRSELLILNGEFDARPFKLFCTAESSHSLRIGDNDLLGEAGCGMGDLAIALLLVDFGESLWRLP